jgi:hypothetical protein
MEPHTISAAFWSAAALLGMVCLLGFGYSRYRIDRLRQKLFALRDELFDYAAAGNIPFDHDAYGMLRHTINGFIRFSHILSITGILMTAMLERIRGPLPGQSFHARWQKTTTTLAPEVGAAMDGFMNRLHLLIAQHVLGVSTLWLLITAYRSKKTIEALYACLTRKLDRMDGSALAFGG